MNTSTANTHSVAKVGSNPSKEGGKDRKRIGPSKNSIPVVRDLDKNKRLVRSNSVWLTDSKLVKEKPKPAPRQIRKSFVETGCRAFGRALNMFTPSEGMLTF